MPESNQENILVMALFTVTKNDVLTCAHELGIPEEQVTDEVIKLVKKKISLDLRGWREVVKSMVKEALRCPLGLLCSPTCAFREIGECPSPKHPV